MKSKKKKENRSDKVKRQSDKVESNKVKRQSDRRQVAVQFGQSRNLEMGLEFQIWKSRAFCNFVYLATTRFEIWTSKS